MGHHLIVVVVRGHVPASVIVKGGRRHCLPSSAAQSGERGQADGRAVVVVFKLGQEAHRSRAGQVCSHGSDKLKQYGQEIVDNWPWLGGHSTWSSPTLFMVDY